MHFLYSQVQIPPHHRRGGIVVCPPWALQTRRRLLPVRRLRPLDQLGAIRRQRRSEDGAVASVHGHGNDGAGAVHDVPGGTAPRAVRRSAVAVALDGVAGAVPLEVQRVVHGRHPPQDRPRGRVVRTFGLLVGRPAAVELVVAAGKAGVGRCVAREPAARRPCRAVLGGVGGALEPAAACRGGVLRATVRVGG